MNAEVKKNWVAALRSGKYRQGIRQLRDKDGAFCCLGVLCDIMDSSKWKIGDYGEFTYEGGSSLLNTPTLNRAELSHGYNYDLANLNDSGKTFSQIAQYIEENL